MTTISTKAFALCSVAVVASASGPTKPPCSECKGKSSSKLARPSELPIYDHNSWHKVCTMKKQTEPNILEGHVRTTRLLFTDVWGSLSDSTAKVAHFIATGKAHTIGTIYYLRDEHNILPRVGAIVAGGLGGILLGVRGKFFKKAFYGGFGAGAVASMCYPNEAQQVAKSSFTIAKYYGIIGYNRVKSELSNKKDEKPKALKKVETTIDNIGEQINKAVEEVSVPVAKAIEKDYGQSNPDDKDLYTTRGS